WSGKDGFNEGVEEVQGKRMEMKPVKGVGFNLGGKCCFEGIRVKDLAALTLKSYKSFCKVSPCGLLSLFNNFGDLAIVIPQVVFSASVSRS
ncbi:hypothetical protein Tco_1150414, partial [Tanacetum coccineum]